MVLCADSHMLEIVRRIDRKKFVQNSKEFIINLVSTIEPFCKYSINGIYILENEFFQDVISERGGGGETDEEKLQKLEEVPVNIPLKGFIIKAFLGFFQMGIMHIDENNRSEIEGLLEGANLFQIESVLLKCMEELNLLNSISEKLAYDYALQKQYSFMAYLIPKWAKLNNRENEVMYYFRQERTENCPEEEVNDNNKRKLHSPNSEICSSSRSSKRPKSDPIPPPQPEFEISEDEDETQIIENNNNNVQEIESIITNKSSLENYVQDSQESPIQDSQVQDQESQSQIQFSQNLVQDSEDSQSQELKYIDWADYSQKHNIRTKNWSPTLKQCLLCKDKKEIKPSYDHWRSTHLKKIK